MRCYSLAPTESARCYSLYYQFCGLVLESDATFEGKVMELCRELGECDLFRSF